MSIRGRFTKGLEDEVQRGEWIALANWYAKRNRRTGHLYQSCYKAFLVEDAGVAWSVSAEEIARPGGRVIVVG